MKKIVSYHHSVPHELSLLCLCSYRYTLDDLFPMMNAVKQRAELYDEWASRVSETLEAKLEKKKGTQQRTHRKQSTEHRTRGFICYIGLLLVG